MCHELCQVCFEEKNTCQCPLVHVMTCASDFRLSVSLKRSTGGEPLETFSPDELAEFGGWVCRFRHVTWLFHE